MTTTESTQASLEEYTAGTYTEDVTLFIVCPLETNQRKSDYLREAIDEWQDIARATPLNYSHHGNRINGIGTIPGSIR